MHTYAFVYICCHVPSTSLARLAQSAPTTCTAHCEHTYENTCTKEAKVGERPTQAHACGVRIDDASVGPWARNG
jgi:hypothetical protein